jgi:hypothetical protein
MEGKKGHFARFARKIMFLAFLPSILPVDSSLGREC